MELTRQHLVPIFEQIVGLLSADPDELARFEPWAKAQTVRLREAAEHGKPSLSFEADLLREELASMARDQRSEGPAARLRHCQELWLTGLLDFVDDLVAPAPPLVPWAA